MSKKSLPTRLQERIDALMDMSRPYEEVMRNDTSTSHAPFDFKTSLQNSDVLKPEQAGTLSVLPEVSPVRRVVPNAMLRGSLFGVIAKGNRRYEKKELKATTTNLTIKFSGEQLDQADLDVYLECVRRCSGVPLGGQVSFFAYDFLKSIERDTGKSQYEWLKDSFLRLMTCAVEIGDGRFFYTGHIVNDNYRDEETGEFIISLNPKIAVFFSTEQWTGLSREERYLLKGKPLAQWLHGFYSTHANPHQYKVETIKYLSGSISSLKEFRRMLKKNLVNLSTVTSWQCWIDENDLVHVVKKK